MKHLCEWKTCCCCYQIELRYLLDALNKTRIDEGGVNLSCMFKCLSICEDGCQQDNNVCATSVKTFSNLTSFSSSILCEKGVDEY